jgi:hypothetical protein
LTDRIEAPARRVFRKVHATALRQGRVTKRPDPDVLFSTIVGAAIYTAGVRGEGNAKTMRDVRDLAIKSSCLP